ncbi:MAG TPA: 4-alpha-glucanotransferase [Dehalococcoidia bacterium]|nr:4-alpha-glucanotransferase [Dehalococcoidia bacterium]
MARLYGVETSYHDVRGATQYANPEGVIAVLRGLDVPVESPSEITDVLRARRLELARRVVEPVIVAWDGRLRNADLRLPSHVSGRLDLTITLEGGDHHIQHLDVGSLPRTAENDFDGRRFITRQFSVPRRLPTGYHGLRLRGARTSASALVISAPTRAYSGGKKNQWGVFLPLYALHTSRSWGAGNYSDLQRLIDWTAELGGDAVATLPLFAAFLDRPFEPSPYSPASRLFWNEFFVDIEAVPELAQSEAARETMGRPAFRRRLTSLRNDETVHYKTGMALRREVLEELAVSCSRKGDIRAFTSANSLAEDYARFRAAMEAQRKPWAKWPEPLRGGHLSPDDYDPDVMRYHLYVQMLTWEQMRSVSGTARRRGVALYLDMPLGASPASYDVWRERESFAVRLSGGAPPDALFSHGQNWGFPPAHPEAIRKHGYRYWISVVRHLMKASGVLRVDHVIGFHHLYCIPAGYDARHGVYVRYHPEEFYAILSLESHRNKTLVVGEDLGTVPRYLPPAMRRHGIYSTYVAQFHLNANRAVVLPRPRPLTVATINTHDTPTFAAFWQGHDIDDRLDMGLTTPTDAENEREKRAHMRKATLTFLRRQGLLGRCEDDHVNILRALLVAMGSSPTRLVLANIEDLWGAPKPQNTPGTTTERVNWRNRARLSLNEMRQLEEVLEPLVALDAARKRRRK